MANLNPWNDKRAGNPDFFTGEVFTMLLSEPSDPQGVRVIAVEFTPGSRSHWHSHPGGQVLHILSGEGVVANSEGQRLRMRTGETVTARPGELHWHGASTRSSMLQMSITSGGETEWEGQAVPEDDYREVIEEAT